VAAPATVGPLIAAASPGHTDSEASLTAVNDPNDFDNPTASTTGPPAFDITAPPRHRRAGACATRPAIEARCPRGKPPHKPPREVRPRDPRGWIAPERRCESARARLRRGS